MKKNPCLTCALFIAIMLIAFTPRANAYDFAGVVIYPNQEASVIIDEFSLDLGGLHAVFNLFTDDTLSAVALNDIGEPVLYMYQFSDGEMVCSNDGVNWISCENSTVTSDENRVNWPNGDSSRFIEQEDFSSGGIHHLVINSYSYDGTLSGIILDPSGYPYMYAYIDSYGDLLYSTDGQEWTYE